MAFCCHCFPLLFRTKYKKVLQEVEVDVRRPIKRLGTVVVILRCL